MQCAAHKLTQLVISQNTRTSNSMKVIDCMYNMYIQHTIVAQKGVKHMTISLIQIAILITVLKNRSYDQGAILPSDGG